MPEITASLPENIQKLLQSRHPEHKANCDEWCFFRTALEGGSAYVADNLFKYPKEDGEVYAVRKKRAADHHYNISRMVIDAYVGMLFSKEPTKGEDLPDEIEEFLKAADADGNDIYAVAQEIAEKQLGFGIVWVAVDKPQHDTSRPLTVAEERELNLRPYVYLTDPTHMLDGRIEKGEPTWLLVKEDYRDDANPLSATFEDRVRYRLWLPNEWMLFEPNKDHPNDLSKAIMVDQGVNAIGVIPFVPIRYGKGSGFSSPGLIKDIAHIDRAIFNKLSQIDEIHYQVTFPQLRYPYSGQLVREKEDGGFERTAEGQMIMTVGLDSVVPYDSESGAPDYFAPPDGPAATLEASVDKMVHRALSLAFLEGDIGVPSEEGGGKAAASGVSKSYDFEKLNKRLATVGSRLEDGIQRVCRLVMRWYGWSVAKTLELPKVLDFPDNFEVKSFGQLIADDLALGSLGIGSKTFAALLKKEIVRRRMPKLKDAELAKIDAEIEQTEADNETMRTAMMNGEMVEDEEGNPKPADEEDEEEAEDDA